MTYMCQGFEYIVFVLRFLQILILSIFLFQFWKEKIGFQNEPKAQLLQDR